MSTPIRLEYRNVTMRFAGKAGAPITAIADVSFALRDREVVALIGPSGCGKSTLLNIGSGLYQASQGDAYVDGERVTAPNAHVAFMLQKDLLLPWRSIIDNVTFGLEIQGRRPGERVGRARDLLESFGLAEFAKYYPHQLSGGMRQRVALARTLAVDPTVLLLDEPFSAVDAQTRIVLQRDLARTLQRAGKTALLITHDLVEATLMSDRVLVMSHRPGHIIDEIRDRSAGPRRPDRTAPAHQDRRVCGRADGSAGDRQAATRRGRGMSAPARTSARRGAIASLVLLVVFLAAWEWGPALLGIPSFIVPPFSAVATEGVRMWNVTHLMFHTGVTFAEVIAGFVIGSLLGAIIGYLLGMSPSAELALSPYILALQIAPKVAFAPLFVLWMGFTVYPKILVAVLIVFFPVMINVLTAIRTVDPDLINLARSFKATRARSSGRSSSRPHCQQPLPGCGLPRPWRWLGSWSVSWWAAISGSGSCCRSAKVRPTPPWCSLRSSCSRSLAALPTWPWCWPSAGCCTICRRGNTRDFNQKRRLNRPFPQVGLR